MSTCPTTTSVRSRPCWARTDCSFFTGPGGEHFTVATSIVGSRTFPSWLRAMRRVGPDGRSPVFHGGGATAELRRACTGSSQSWILTFPDMATLDAQFDEAKIAMGEIRSIKELDEVRVERLLGRGAAGVGSQRWRISAARPSLAFFQG